MIFLARDILLWSTASAASVGNRAPAVLRRREQRRFSSASDDEVGGLLRAMREQQDQNRADLSAADQPLLC